ncbi:uncharacterized protein LOC118510791 [Anopheles stephensi]|uniref:uncharacterized protein LOC118510791 n=1 Tax=Anopheles stephensi TaxID=30069 RepID=UPI001658AC58|nr:uncharacterized protein LOC118510791 [Anopheles stephensi]
MPLALRLLRVIGVWGDLTRYRYILVFVCYCFGIVIPKVCFGYPSAEASIRGYTELILETNVFAGMLMLYVRYDHFKLLLVELGSFVSIGKMEADIGSGLNFTNSPYFCPQSNVKCFVITHHQHRSGVISYS